MQPVLIESEVVNGAVRRVLSLPLEKTLFRRFCCFCNTFASQNRMIASGR